MIIRPAALGDTLMLLPALDQIRHSFSVLLVGRRPGIHYAEPFTRLCLDFEGMGWHTIFTERPEVPNLPHVDIAAAFLKDVEGRVAENLRVLLPEAPVHVFPGRPEEEEGIHAALHLARCLRAAGCAKLDPEACIERAHRRPLLRTVGIVKKTRVVFHPGSGGREKNHSPESWVDLIEKTGHKPFCEGLVPTLVLGPAEEGLRAFFEGAFGRSKPEVVSSPNPMELVALLRESALFLGQDSGVTHLAAMLGAPTIALFRSSSVQTWRPLGPDVTVIKDKNDRVDVPLIVKEAERCLKRQ